MEKVILLSFNKWIYSFAIIKLYNLNQRFLLNILYLIFQEKAYKALFEW